jgi:hypothetical protein
MVFRLSMPYSIMPLNYLKSILEGWKEELKSRTFKLKLLLVPGLFFVYSAITQPLGNYVQLRKGIQLHDRLLYLFPSFDFSPQIFMLLYASLSLIILTHLNKPKIIVRVLEMHLFVAVVRQACILMVALEPPAGLIVLRDVFLENTVYPHNSPLTKDLFFSGHVASIWIYFLCAEKKYIKIYLGLATLMMSFMVLSMRVHYTYDVYGALIITSIIYFAPARIRPFYIKMKEQFLLLRN